MRDKKEQAIGVSVYIKVLTGGQAWRIHWMRRLLDRQVFIWEEGLGRLEQCGTAIRIWEVLGTLFFSLWLIPLHLRFMAIERRNTHIPLRAVFFSSIFEFVFSTRHDLHV
jgi:hypothetical protein